MACHNERRFHAALHIGCMQACIWGVVFPLPLLISSYSFPSFERLFCVLSSLCRDVLVVLQSYTS